MMTGFWLLILALKDFSIVDIFEGTGFVLQGLMMWSLVVQSDVVSLIAEVVFGVILVL